MEPTTAQSFDVDQARELAHHWMDAWNRKDADALLALMTDDIAYDDPALAETAHGKEDVRAFTALIWRAMPDMRFTEPMGMFVAQEGPRIIAPWHMSAAFTGPLDPPGFAPTGDRVELDGVDVWELRDGKVCRYWAYYDNMDVGRQVGLLPARKSRAERAGARLQRLTAAARRRRR